MNPLSRVLARVSPPNFTQVAILLVVQGIFILAVGAIVPVCSIAVVPDFVAFESESIRPLALSPDGRRLYAVNTPDGRLEIFDVLPDGLTHVDSAPVGMEPVAVAVRANDEVWVINHLSDSASIVDARTLPARVTRTLLLCDEPRDIVFAGVERDLAFITSARRGQNCPLPALLTTQGTPRGLVTVYDAADPGLGLRGSPVSFVELFSDKPRALAVSTDGETVFAAAFHSGNRTTSVHRLAVCDGGVSAPPCEFNGVMFPGGLPEPNFNFEGIAQPKTALIVRYDLGAGAWLDELGRDWSDYVRFDLPDYDLFVIDASAAQPYIRDQISGVGTILFNIAVNPANGRIYVSNTEARNDVRFATPTRFGHSPLRGRQHEARISVVEGAAVRSVHLNPHIDYDAVPVAAGVRDRSISTPLEMAVSRDGTTLYLVSMGTNKVAILPTSALETGTYDPWVGQFIDVEGGPSGIILDEVRGRLYVATRYDNAVSVLDLAERRELNRIRLHNPESHATVQGRPYLYDALLTSSNGEASCASCHVFGDFDGLAWDLGDAAGAVVQNPNPSESDLPLPDFHPLKGPMVTMSLRGMATHGPLHMRGDRTGPFDSPPADPMNFRAAFRTFNSTFPDLLGRDEGEIDDADMSKFADFAARILYPPNPIRNLDNRLSAEQIRGQTLFHQPIMFTPVPAHRTCQGCHRIDPAGGFYGSNGRVTQGMDVPLKNAHLRNLYQKVGMFGMVAVPIHRDLALLAPGDNHHMGPQVRGFGFEHSGAIDTLFRFLGLVIFTFPGDTPSERLQGRRDLEAYLFAVESDLAPIVGQQVTLSSDNAVEAGQRVDLLIERAKATYPNIYDTGTKECDLVAKGLIDGKRRGFLYRASRFHADVTGESLLDSELRALAAKPGQELTFTCVPPGSGFRSALDRDGDGLLDGDESGQGGDPNEAERIPGGGSSRTDCLSAFTVINPANPRQRDRRGNLHTIQSCHDGDPLCDADGIANGRCEFVARICFNTDMTGCNAEGLASWQLRPSAKDSSQSPVDGAMLDDLIASVRALEFKADQESGSRTVVFPVPVTARKACTDPVRLPVSLRGGNRDRTASMRIATTSVSIDGMRDSDRLRLVCHPPIGRLP